MIIGKKHYTSIWYDNKKDRVKIIDQTLLPHKFKIKELYNLNNDLSEQNNIAKEHPEIVVKLDSLRINWNNELIDPVFLGLIHTEMWKNRKKKTLESNNQRSK